MEKLLKNFFRLPVGAAAGDVGDAETRTNKKDMKITAKRRGSAY